MASIACTIVLNYLSSVGDARRSIESNYPGIVVALLWVMGREPEEGRCPFCGASLPPNRLKLHIYRCHRGELTALCASVREVMAEFVKKGRKVEVFGQRFRNLVEALEWVKGVCVAKRTLFAR